MIIQGYSTVKVYMAQARILIDDERATAVPGLQGEQNQFYEDPEPYFQTQYKILKGRDLTRRVVRKLRLDTVPEFNGTKPAPPTASTLLQEAKDKIIGIAKPNAPAEAPKVDETADESGLVSAFIGRVSVDPVRGSHLVDVSFVSEDPKFAASVRSARTRSRTRRSAVLCVAGVLAGLALVLVGLITTKVALSVVGFVLLVPFYALRAMGAGDVKLLAAMGALLGPQTLLVTAAGGALVGGMMSLIILARRGRISPSA